MIILIQILLTIFCTPIKKINDNHILYTDNMTDTSNKIDTKSSNEDLQKNLVVDNKSIEDYNNKINVIRQQIIHFTNCITILECDNINKEEINELKNNLNVIKKKEIELEILFDKFKRKNKF